MNPYSCAYVIILLFYENECSNIDISLTDKWKTKEGLTSMHIPLSYLIIVHLSPDDIGQDTSPCHTVCSPLICNLCRIESRKNRDLNPVAKKKNTLFAIFLFSKLLLTHEQSWLV